MKPIYVIAWKDPARGEHGWVRAYEELEAARHDLEMLTADNARGRLFEIEIVNLVLGTGPSL